MKDGLSECSAHSGEKGGGVGRLYRWVLDGVWARSLQSGLQRRPGYRETPAEAAAAQEASPWAQPDSSQVRPPPPDLVITLSIRDMSRHAWHYVQDISVSPAEQLQVVFMCSRETLKGMIKRWPALAGMDANDVLARLISLKARPVWHLNCSVLACII